MPWGKHAARYRLQDDGTVVRDGNLDDLNLVEKRIQKWLRRSHVYLRAWRKLARPSHYRLMAALIKASRDHALATWPGCQFHLLLWDMDWPEETIAAFDAAGLEYTLVSDILPGFFEHPERYEIHPGDRHPTAYANRLIAEWIVRETLDAR